jgi:hypothetical protein
VIIIAALFYLFDPVDFCLDGGGCWDRTDGLCRKDEVNAQELCDRSRAD